MAFNGNELGVIRTYVAITGEAPTQAQLQAAFDNTGLDALATDLINSRPAQGNTAFVTSLYENLLGRAPDAAGLEYWTSLLSSSAEVQLSKARLAVEFQNVAALNADSEEGLVDGTAGLTSVNGEFADPTDDDDDDGEQPTDITFDFNFDTSKGESDVAGWTHEKYDDTVTESQNEKTYMSNTNKIFNVGMEAIDQGVPTISRDYSFRVENQLGEMGHYDAYFLSPVLDNVTTNLGSVLTVEVIDRMAEANDKDAALSLVAIESFSFRLNGEQVEVGSEAILNAETYEELAAAIEARIAVLAEDNPALAAIEVSLGQDFTRQQVDADTLNTTGANVLGTQIVLTATGNNLIERGGFSFGERSGVDRNVDPSGRQDTNVLGSETDLITTNLEFKNVGYGSQGGSVNVSGQSQSDKGVQQFDIVAEKHNLGLGVWLTELSSNPLRAREDINFLEVINLTGDAAYFHVGEEQTAALSANGGSVRDGADFAGLTDVRVFNASQFNQNVRINAEVTEDVIGRDLDLVDTQDNGAEDNVTYNYNLGGGDNSLYLSVSESVIAHEDAALSINSGSGNDRIVLELNNDETAPTNWYLNQKDLKNIVINTGAGSDVISTIGAGDATILAGSGNDTVYTDNSGEKAQWVFNAQNTDVNDLRGDVLTSNLLYNATLTVTISGANVGGGVTADGFGGTIDNAADAFANGFESTVTIPTSGLVGNERSINQAIKDAINNDSVLSKLLVAEDGPDNTLIVRSLIDGAFEADDLVVDIAAADLADFSNSEKSSLTSFWQSLPGNSSQVTPTDVQLQALLDNGVLGAQASGVGYDGNSVFGDEAAVIATGVETTTGAAAVAEVLEEQTLDFAGVTVADGDTLTFNIDGTVVTYTAAGGDGATAASIATAVAGLAAPAGYVFTDNGGTVTVAQTAGNGKSIAPISVGGTSANAGNVGVTTVTDGVAAAAAVPEVQTIDLGTASVAVGGSLTFTVDGTDVVYTNNTVNPLTGGALVADIAANTADFTDAAGTLTYTQPGGSESDIPAITVSEGVVTPLSGSQSTVESNNVINMGVGQDVLVLGTGELSNDVLVWTGYNNGENTVVNFMDDANETSVDLINFDAYLNGQTNASGSTESVRDIADTVVADNTFNADGVSFLTAFDFTVAENETWDALTASNLLAALKSTTDTYAGANGGDFTLQDNVADLVGNERDHIVFVENNLNDGEYKIFHVTSTEQTDGTEVYTAANLVGTVDFGDSIDAFATANLA